MVPSCWGWKMERVETVCMCMTCTETVGVLNAWEESTANL